jgi:histidine triad (HIT) family protein
MTTSSDCVFCDIVNGLSPANVVYEDDAVLAFVPLNPVVDGHIIVVPKTHSDDFTESPSLTAITVSRASALASKMGPVNLITSRGREATQSVFHLHIHLVPRKEGDGLQLPWSDQLKKLGASTHD